jgi:hypothetical protein
MTTAVAILDLALVLVVIGMALQRVSRGRTIDRATWLVLAVVVCVSLVLAADLLT